MSWQFDKGVSFDGVTNKFFKHESQKFTLVPLTPSQVRKDQERLQKECEAERKKKEDSKSERVEQNVREKMVDKSAKGEK